MTYAIGSVSHCTMRPEDLLPVFADELEKRQTDGAHDDLIAEARKLAARFESGEDPAADDVDGVMSDLFDALNDVAPPYCTFGANEGDGADYGFWPDIDRLEEDAGDVVDAGTDVLKVNDLGYADAAICEAVAERTSVPEFVMLVNNHGNVTLYRPVVSVQFEEVWAVV
jgi:hypothetical protein